MMRNCRIVESRYPAYPLQIVVWPIVGGVYDVIVDGVIMNNRVLIGSTQSANDTVYLHKDHLGSVEATTNALGQFVNRMSFGAWGERQKADWKPGSPTETFLTTNGFTGHDQLDSHNLVHMGGRVYDPSLGRFLSADLFIQSPYDSQSYNRYSYTFNNPLSYIDPTGYMSDMITWAMQASYNHSSSWMWSNDVRACNCMVNKTIQEKRNWEVRNSIYEWEYVGDEAFNVGGGSFNDQIKAQVAALNARINGSGGVRAGKGSAGAAGVGLRLPSLSSVTNFTVGLGNTVSFGIGGYLSEKVNGSGSFDKNSDAFAVGSYAGVLSSGGVIKGAGNVAAKEVAELTIKQINPRNLISQQSKNEMSGSVIKRLVKDMKLNGFDQSQAITAVVRADGRLVISDGHHRAAAAIRAGIDKVPVDIYNPF
jgi:RHS repeat-associated protein